MSERCGYPDPILPVPINSRQLPDLKLDKVRFHGEDPMQHDAISLNVMFKVEITEHQVDVNICSGHGPIQD